MKYKAIIETDDYKDFKFFEDGNGTYMIGKDENAKGEGWIPLYFTECKHEPVLDKIRAEIDIARFIDKDTRICKNALASGLEVAMQIIDKYGVEK